MSNIIPFHFDSHPIRVQVDDDGKPWWVAKDVCDVLALANVTKAVARLKNTEKGVTPIQTHGGIQSLTIINESGLYRLIFRSDKPDAQRFQDWVFEEVLPAIRETGQYQAQSETPRVPQVKDPAIQMLIDMAVHLDEARTLAAQANAKADLAMASQQWLTIRQYVFLHQLERQMPDSAKKAYGTWLTGHCLEKGIPVEDRGVGDRNYKTEHAYHAETISQTLPQWLMRREGQLDIYRVK
jgi:prophage antirepressor-like protein